VVGAAGHRRHDAGASLEMLMRLPDVSAGGRGVDSMKFGERLRELRQEKGMTLRDVAEGVGLDFSYLSKIENHKTPPPSEKTITRLAATLNVSLDALYPYARKIPKGLKDQLEGDSMELSLLLYELSLRRLTLDQHQLLKRRFLHRA